MADNIIIRQCLICGKEFEIVPQKAKYYYDRIRFCSAKCKKIAIRATVNYGLNIPLGLQSEDQEKRFFKPQ